MGASIDHLQRHPATGRLSFRRAIPADLRPFVPGEPREIKRSLAATRIDAPGALDRYRAASAEYDRLVAIATKAAHGTFDPLDDARMAWIAETFRATVLAKDEAQRRSGNPPDRETLEAAQDGYGETYANYGPAYRGMFEAEALAIAEGQGWRLDTASEAFGTLDYMLLKVAIEATEVQIGRSSGAPVPTPEAPPAPSAPLRHIGRSTPPSEPSRSFQEVAEAILINPRMEVGAATVQTTRTALRFFRETHGPDIQPRAITRRHVSEWLDLLAQRPAPIQANERSLPLRDLVARYADKPEARRITGKTLNQNLTALAAIWVKAQQNGAIPTNLENPFARHKVKVAPPAETPQEMSLAELQATFALPVFTAGERPTRGKGEASFWIPLLLLWTGARPEEIAQLMVSDVTQDPDTAA
jgi:hypothetical protein